MLLLEISRTDIMGQERDHWGLSFDSPFNNTYLFVFSWTEYQCLRASGNLIWRFYGQWIYSLRVSSPSHEITMTHNEWMNESTNKHPCVDSWMNEHEWIYVWPSTPSSGWNFIVYMYILAYTIMIIHHRPASSARTLLLLFLCTRPLL